MTDFDTPIDRNGTHSAKLDMLLQRFGERDIAPLWVADMQFASPSAVVAAIKARAAHPIYGYTVVYEQFNDSIVSWQRRRHDWSFESSSVVASVGVVPSLALCVEAFTLVGDGVLIQPPIYPPFISIVKNSGRKLLENPLHIVDGVYEIDWKDLEKKAANAKMLLFCSPHNPCGRVWSEGELEKLSRIAQKHDLIVISDEIHADVVFTPHKHIPLAKFLQQKTVTLSAASKSFNIAGLATSYAIIENDSLRRRYETLQSRFHISTPNLFGLIATTAAYADGEKWLGELLRYLESNRNFALDFISKNMPQVTVFVPQGTYLMWLNFANLGLNDEELKQFLVHKAKVALNPGYTFGSAGSGFARLNFALPKKELLAALGLMAEESGKIIA